MDRGVRAIVSHRLPNAEELEAGCGDWLKCCQAYIHTQDCARASATKAREPLTDEKITQQVAEMRARLSQCSSAGVAYRVKWHDVKAIIATIQTLQERLSEEKKWHDDHAEREAAVCPEDFPCDEYIRHLEVALSSRDTEIREVLEGLRNERGCWCRVDREAHTADCLATQALYTKLQPGG